MATVEEKYLDGTIVRHVAVRFRNPTANAVQLTGKNAVAREVQVWAGKTRPDGESGKRVPIYENRALDVEIPAGHEGLVPAEVADALQQFFCRTCECPWRYARVANPRTTARVCHDRDHLRQLVGGLATQLAEVADSGVVVETEKHPNLVEVPPAPPIDVNALHERVRARMLAAEARK